MNRITELFQRKDRNLLSVYFTAGYPVLEDTVEIIQMLENRGVDLVEIGIPFSDPMADGVVIQQSSTQALKNGMTLPVLLEQLTSIRSRVELPLLLMGYLNPMLQYGMENLFRKGMEIGIDGMIIPDLPFQEYLESVKPLCEKYDIPVIMLITPETSDERIRLIDEYCGGFIYMVSSASTTGVKDRFTAGQIEYFQRIDRLNLKNKRLIGFGISNGETLSTVCRYSSGAIIGSLFVIKPTFTNMALVPSLIGLCGGICAGIAYAMVRILGQRGQKGSSVVIFFSGFSCVVTLPYLLLDFHPMSGLQILTLLGAGLAAAGGQFGITAAYYHAPAKEISIYDYSQIIFSTILGFFLFGQVPDRYSVLGYVIICAMALWMFVYNKNRE